MDKVKMTTPDGVTENIEKLAALFPAAVTEMRGEDGTLRKGIDFEKLRQLLSRDIVEGGERYEFSWVGKKAAMAEAARPTTETLRPVKADSRNWDTTENLYIEGDNLAALKILQESYLGKVKMIYIDPPYNTGNDFIYADDFMRTQDEENEQMGMFDEEENHLFKNTDSNGRFHSDWCSMIYSRLMLARNLLTSDGAIFISIDDNEQENLKKICDEVFGATNYVATFPWRKRTAKSDVPFGVSQDYEWVICYAKSENFIASVTGKERKYYETPDFPNRPWRVHDLTKQTSASERPNSYFTIVNPKNGKQYPANPNATWRITKETLDDYLAQHRIVFPGDYDFLRISKPVLRYWKEDDIAKAGENFGRIAVSTKLNDDIGMSQDGTKEITNIFNGKIFSFPKPSSLIKFLASIHTSNNDIILDFFSGSATTAHAVMQLNAEDGGHRKFIMVQLPEPCDEKSEAYKAGYKNICEIGKERIRRAGDAILKENDCWKSVPLNRNDGSKVGDYTPAKIVNTVNTNKGPVEMVDISKDLSKLDIGFRVFRVDSSNMRDVYYKPEEFTQTMLGEAVSNIKPDRTDLDLLYACLLGCSVPIHLPHTTTTVDGCTIHNVDNGALMACFDEHIPHSVIRAMAAEAPLQVIFRDSAFAADADKINVTEIFKNLSPDTKVRVI